MDKMWAGRFSKALDKTADDFNSSIHTDCRMYRQDIKGSMAHASMLAAQKIIADDDCELILSGLEGILRDIDSGLLKIDMDCEDIHMFVEAELTKRIGEAGKRLHTAAQPQRQVALDIRMYLRDESAQDYFLIKSLISALLKQAEENEIPLCPAILIFSAHSRLPLPFICLHI